MRVRILTNKASAPYSSGVDVQSRLEASHNLPGVLSRPTVSIKSAYTKSVPPLMTMATTTTSMVKTSDYGSTPSSYRDGAATLIKSHALSPHTGFVPPHPPLQTLPSYFQAWDDLASQLPTLLETKTLHHRVAVLPVLEAANLTTPEQCRRAYVVLGFLVHGYVHSAPNRGDDAPVKVPQQLAAPWFEVCKRWGMEGKETLAYAGLCSWNWRALGKEAENEGWGGLEELESLVTFTGGRDEEVFYLVPVMVERVGGEGVWACVEALLAAKDGRVDVVKDCLTVLRRVLIEMRGLMGLLHEHCNADVFWKEVRPWLAGGKGTEGWMFELGNGQTVTRWNVGGSAAQSSTVACFDAALGVEHKSLDTEGSETVFDEMRGYMPGHQRAFLDEVETMESLASFVEGKADDKALVQAYNDVLEELARWRSRHIGVVTTHIVNEARKEQNGIKPDEVKDGLSVKDESELQGTGGSALIPFLKGARLDTEAIMR